MEDNIKQINNVVSEYIEGKIDEQELVNRLFAFNSPKFEEECVRNGFFVIPSLLHSINDRLSVSYESEEKAKRVLEEVRGVLKEYYDEIKAGVDPRYSKIQFTYSWHFHEFVVEVKNGMS